MEVKTESITKPISAKQAVIGAILTVISGVGLNSTGDYFTKSSSVQETLLANEVVEISREIFLIEIIPENMRSMADKDKLLKLKKYLNLLKGE